MPLNLEAIKAATPMQPQTKDVPCPELGGDVRIIKLPGPKGLVVRQHFYSGDENTPLSKEQIGKAYTELIAACVTDESNAAILDTKEGREVLANLDPDVFERLASECLNWNGMVGKKN